MNNTAPFKTFFEVRDNEIDIQGIVNNANYMIYLAHARHNYIHEKGIDFSAYAKQGLNLVVISCQLNFKYSLKPRDKFYVTCAVKATDSALKFSFYQEIRLVSQNIEDESDKSNKLILDANFIATCVNENATKRSKRILIPDELKKLYDQ